MLTLVVTSRSVIMGVRDMFEFLYFPIFSYYIIFGMRKKIKNLPVMKKEHD